MPRMEVAKVGPGVGQSAQNQRCPVAAYSRFDGEFERGQQTSSTPLRSPCNAGGDSGRCRRVRTAWPGDDCRFSNAPIPWGSGRTTSCSAGSGRKRRRTLGLPDGRVACNKPPPGGSLERRPLAAERTVQRRMNELADSLAALNATIGRSKTSLAFWHSRELASDFAQRNLESDAAMLSHRATFRPALRGPRLLRSCD
jgi:hypothetical protein